MKLLDESIELAKLHFKRARFNYLQLQKIAIDSELWNDEETISIIDAFIFRFIKLQDYMGDKLFRRLLDVAGDYKENMSLMDVLDRLEKLELLPSVERWKDYREVRNQLTHEYPDNRSDIKKAIEYLPEIEAILIGIENYAISNLQ